MPEMPRTFRPAFMPTRIERNREHDRRRDEQEWRGWYKTARWQKLKRDVHVRDLYICQVTGVLCSGRHPADDSPVADHKVEHEGDPDLFWDMNNVRTVSKAFHDSERQKEQAAGRGQRQPFSIPRNVRRSGVPVHLVCGAPGSGKSTYVRAHARPGDVVIDFDDIRQRLGMKRYSSEPRDLRRAFAERDRMIEALAGRHSGEAWLVVMAPTDAERSAWVKALGTVTVVAIDTDAEECKRRIRADATRQGSVDALIRAVDDYAMTRGGGQKSPTAPS